MKKIIVLIFILVLLAPSQSFAATATKAKVVAKPVAVKKAIKPVYSAKDLLGRFLIESESYDRLWYGDGNSQKRYYLKDDNDLKWLIDRLAVKVSADELKKIPAHKNALNKYNYKKYYGQIIVDESGSAWYVNPIDKIRYPLKDFQTAYQTMKVIGLKVDDNNLRKMAMNGEQLTFDAAFPNVAYVKYDGQNFSDGYYNKTILPLASLSKLMTALVLLDQNLDWEKSIVVTAEEINYPKTQVGDDGTSEVALKAGDKVKINDLWIALLSASSNQSSAILVDNSGLTRLEFISQMNKKAQELGLIKTVFYEFSGLNVNNISTPEEFALIANAAFAKAKIAQATNVVNYDFPAENNGETRNVNVKNRNYSLLAFNPEASKTGYLVEARSNVALQKDGNIIVVMHASGSAQRNQIVRQLIGESKLSYGQ